VDRKPVHDITLSELKKLGKEQKKSVAERMLEPKPLLSFSNKKSDSQKITGLTIGDAKRVKDLSTKIRAMKRTASKLKGSAKTKGQVGGDLWGTDMGSVVPQRLKDIEECVVRRPPKKRRVSEKPVPNLVIPHPGQSYNPDKGERRVLTKELQQAAKRKRKNVAKAQEIMDSVIKGDKAGAMKVDLVPAREGKDEGDDWDIDLPDGIALKPLSKIVRKKKENKMQEKFAGAQKEAEIEKIAKKYAAANSIDKVLASIKKSDQKAKERKELELKAKAESAPATPVYGGRRFVETLPRVVKHTRICGRLSGITESLNPLRDRIASIYRTGKVPAPMSAEMRRRKLLEQLKGNPRKRAVPLTDSGKVVARLCMVLMQDFMGILLALTHSRLGSPPLERNITTPMTQCLCLILKKAYIIT